MSPNGASQEERAYYYTSEPPCSNFVLCSSSSRKFNMYATVLPKDESTPSYRSARCCMNNVKRMTNASMHRPVFGVEPSIYE